MFNGAIIVLLSMLITGLRTAFCFTVSTTLTATFAVGCIAAAAAAFAKLHEKGDSTNNTVETIQQVKAKFELTKQQSFIS